MLQQASWLKKYETNMKKYVLLRKALNEYIRLIFLQEDKNDLLNSVALDQICLEKPILLFLM